MPVSNDLDILALSSSSLKTLGCIAQGPKNLSIAAAAIGKTMPEMFEGENFVRADVLLSGKIDHEAITEAIKINLFRVANNLESPKA